MTHIQENGQNFPNGNQNGVNHNGENQSGDRKSVLEAKKAANVADASKPALTAQEVTELASLS